jgi:hypothetical protein
MEHRPEHGPNRLEALLHLGGQQPAPLPVRGALHAKGGYQVLCVSEDLRFTSEIAHLSHAVDAHPAIAWSVEDLERLPFWTFHGVVLDSQAWSDIEKRASPRVRRLIALRPRVVAPREEAEIALKTLIADMAQVHASNHT